MVVARADRALKVDESGVRFARPLDAARLLVGANDKLGFLDGARVTWFDLPCSPSDAIVMADGALVACEQPLGLVRTSRSAVLASDERRSFSAASGPTFRQRSPGSDGSETARWLCSARGPERRRPSTPGQLKMT